MPPKTPNPFERIQTAIAVLALLGSVATYALSSRFVDRETFETERRNNAVLANNVDNLNKQLNSISTKIDNLIELQLDSKRK